MVTGSLLVPIIVQTINYSPPRFVNPLTDLEIEIQDNLDYTFPNIVDENGDDYTITDINFGLAKSFI
jgi:hypothetical protein